jgi:hypothetical protein
MQINPGEVQAAFFAGRGYNPPKLHAEDIADGIAAMLAMDAAAS